MALHLTNRTDKGCSADRDTPYVCHLPPWPWHFPLHLPAHVHLPLSCCLLPQCSEPCGPLCLVSLCRAKLQEQGCSRKMEEVAEAVEDDVPDELQQQASPRAHYTQY